jgi:DoxX-like protein
MNSTCRKFVISGLRWALGVVVLLESVHFALSASAARQFANNGLPRWIRPALGGSEIIAALLFLIPGSRLAGGYALVFLFLAGAVIHIRHGDINVGSLIVYGMAVIVCMAHSTKESGEVSNDR